MFGFFGALPGPTAHRTRQRGWGGGFNPFRFPRRSHTPAAGTKRGFPRNGGERGQTRRNSATSETVFRVVPPRSREMKTAPRGMVSGARGATRSYCRPRLCTTGLGGLEGGGPRGCISGLPPVCGLQMTKTTCSFAPAARASQSDTDLRIPLRRRTWKPVPFRSLRSPSAHPSRLGVGLLGSSMSIAPPSS